VSAVCCARGGLVIMGGCFIIGLSLAAAAFYFSIFIIIFIPGDTR